MRVRHICPRSRHPWRCGQLHRHMVRLSCMTSVRVGTPCLDAKIVAPCYAGHNLLFDTQLLKGDETTGLCATPQQPCCCSYMLLYLGGQCCRPQYRLCRGQALYKAVAYGRMGMRESAGSVQTWLVPVQGPGHVWGAGIWREGQEVLCQSRQVPGSRRHLQSPGAPHASNQLPS